MIMKTFIHSLSINTQEHNLQATIQSAGSQEEKRVNKHFGNENGLKQYVYSHILCQCLGLRKYDFGEANNERWRKQINKVTSYINSLDEFQNYCQRVEPKLINTCKDDLHSFLIWNFINDHCPHPLHVGIVDSFLAN